MFDYLSFFFFFRSYLVDLQYGGLVSCLGSSRLSLMNDGTCDSLRWKENFSVNI